MSLPAIWQWVSFLREMHTAPVEAWPRFARDADALPGVPVHQGGMEAHKIASAARMIVKHLPHVHASSRAAAQMTLLSLSDLLHQEANAAGVAYPQPFYARD